MATSFSLTYHKARKCWRKKYLGKVYYLGRSGVRKRKDEDYELALTEWEAVKRFVDGEGPNPYVTSKRFDPEGYERQYGEYLTRSFHAKRQARNGRSNGAAVDNGFNVCMATDYSRHDFAPSEITPLPDGDLPLALVCAEYLRQRKSKVDSRKLSVKQYAQDRAKLDDFIGFAKHHGRQLLSEIDGQLLAFYKECQELLTSHSDAKERISVITCRKRLQTIMKLLRWAYKHEYLDGLPRILDSDFTKVKERVSERPKPVFWTVKEIRHLFNTASQRTQLYIALACNCGYTQREIATLEWEMLSGNFIGRLRPKSEQPQEHILWPITYELLLKESKTREGLCLVGLQGNPLLTERVKSDGNITIHDPIRLAFTRTMKAAGLHGTGRTFKHIRKTSADAIAEKYEDDRLVDLFLAHSTRNEMREHYVKQHKTRYFDALAWLESHYKLGE